jgi:hypothetical protein
VTRAKQVVAVGGNRTIYETEGSAQTVNSPGVVKFGSTTLPIGTLVTFSLWLGSAGIWIYLVGHTTSVAYAITGAGSAVASQFYMPSAEKLDIYVDTGASVSYTAAWQGTSP